MKHNTTEWNGAAHKRIISEARTVLCSQVIFRDWAGYQMKICIFSILDFIIITYVFKIKYVGLVLAVMPKG
jgi:hypothetical protein